VLADSSGDEHPFLSGYSESGVFPSSGSRGRAEAGGDPEHGEERFLFNLANDSC
jgi:hypothetical protein